MLVLAFGFASLTTPTASAEAGRGSSAHAVAQAATPLPTATSTYNSAGLTREVFGFAYASDLGDPTFGYPSWNFNLLSTVAFFSIRVDYNGVLVADSNWNVWSSSTLSGLVSAAHAHGVKVVMTLRPNYTDITDFCDMLYNDNTTVGQVVNQVKLKGVDGVNIDYEMSGQAMCNPTNPGLTPMSDQALLTQFAKDMRAGLNAAGPNYYLSIDTYSGSASGPDGFFNIPALNPYVDSFFVMTYDMDYANQGHAPLNCASFCMAPVSPMANYYWNDTTSMSQYSSVVGASKTILGQPYYGRAACVSSPVEHAVASGGVVTPTYVDAASAISSPDIKPGTYVIHRDSADPAGQDRWDSWYDNSLGCWREMDWSDTTTLGARYDLVNQDNLRGVGIWTLDYAGGASELWQALGDHFLGCSSVTDSASPNSPATGGTAVTITAAASCPDPNPLYEFWVLAPGASLYTLAQGYSTANTLNWNASPVAPGTYRFNVWVKDADFAGLHGNSYGRWDAYDANLTYSITSQPCSSVSESATPAGGVMAGTTVSITASATNCPHPVYEFWMLAPGAALYRQVQAYSTNATLTWNTTGSALGAYRFNVWVHDATSWGTYGNAYGRWDSYNASLSMAVTSGCPGVATSASPSSPAMVSMPVTVTASAGGCPNPQYEFWVLKPGASLYTLAQAYSSSPTLNWSTSALAAGTYRINVWVRDASSGGTFSNASGTWDAYNAGLTYTLTPGCPSVGVSAPSASTASGSTLTITAAAQGCPSPVYEFWILAPGASLYTLAQPYSAAATLAWNTTGLAKGTYRINVWVHDSSDAGLYGNSYGRWDTYNATLTVMVS